MVHIRKKSLKKVLLSALALSFEKPLHHESEVEEKAEASLC